MNQNLLNIYEVYEGNNFNGIETIKCQNFVELIEITKGKCGQLDFLIYFKILPLC